MNGTAQAEVLRPATLSAEQRNKIVAWLDKSVRPFTVHATPLTRKRKRDLPAPATETGLLHERLHVHYEVKPLAKWEALRRFKKFTIGSESIAVGECILVKHDEREDGQVDVEEQWKALVLEVKALDSEHVYIRVAWLNRPEDLVTGRKPYHGRRELIPTNQMDVIDAMTVNGKIPIRHWDDKDEQSLAVTDDQYFWRQTYDCVNTKAFSDLHTICIDNAPPNPDEVIMQCPNPQCRLWHHLKCLADRAVESALDEHAGKKKAGKPKAVGYGDPRAQIVVRKGDFMASVYIAGLPATREETKAVHGGEAANGNGASEDAAEANGAEAVTKSEIIVTDDNGDKHPQPLRCLRCRTEMGEN